MYRSVLVPLDGSEFAEYALPLAWSIARRTGSALDLVRVHIVYAVQDPAAAWGPYDAMAEAMMRDSEQEYLDGVLNRLTAAGAVHTQGALVNGPIADGILEHAHAKNVDLVVMTTHGRGPISRFWLGSVADVILRRAWSPVLLVRPQDSPVHLSGDPIIKRILIPLDGSALAEQALGPATSLGRLYEAHYILCQTLENRSATDPPDKALDPEQRRAKTQAYLEGVAHRLRSEGCSVDTRVVVGRQPPLAILNEARDQEVDLVALATHGRGGLQRLVLGSVADKVIRGATLPILVCRPSHP